MRIADSADAETRRDPKSEPWEEEKNSLDEAQGSCGIFAEVKQKTYFCAHDKSGTCVLHFYRIWWLLTCKISPGIVEFVEFGDFSLKNESSYAKTDRLIKRPIMNMLMVEPPQTRPIY